MRLHFTVLLTVLALLAGACVSPEEHYYQGQGYEKSGNYANATNEYLSALEGDANFPGARESATSAGNRATADWYAEAGQMEAARDYRGAAGRYAEIDRLMARASKVGVRLNPGQDFARRRRMTLDAAIDECIADGGRYGSRGEWAKAIELYREAESDYEPDARRSQLLTDARYHTLVAWGESELQAGNARVAAEKADLALAIYGARNSRSGAAADLRERALELAQVIVVPTPTWRVDGLARRVPDRFLRDLDDILEDEHWSAPPEYVSMVDPGSARRELRNLHLDRVVLRESQAASLGRYLGAHLVVVNFLDRFDLVERGVENQQNVRTTDGRPASYTLFEGDRDLTVRAAFKIVDVRTKRVIRSGRAEVRESRPVRRANYRGDANRLDLTRKERSWFDSANMERLDDELMRDAAAGLAAKLAEEVYEELVKETL